MKKIITFILFIALFFSTNVFGAWSFDQTNDDVQITDNAALTFPDGDWTIAGWIKLDDNVGSSWRYFLSWNMFNDNSIYWLIGESSAASVPDDFEIGVTDGDTTVITVSGTSNPGTRTDWIHLIAQRSGTTVTQYIDNVADGSGTDAAFDAVDHTSAFYLGSRSDTDANSYFGGDMVEWAKWDRALNADERGALTDGYSPLFFLRGMTWYCPMFGSVYTERKEALTITNNGSTAGDHPPIIYPK